jgi:hypothetical protein
MATDIFERYHVPDKSKLVDIFTYVHASQSYMMLNL